MITLDQRAAFAGQVRRQKAKIRFGVGNAVRAAAIFVIVGNVFGHGGSAIKAKGTVASPR